MRIIRSPIFSSPVPLELPSWDEKGAVVVIISVFVVLIPWVVENEFEVGVLVGVGHLSALARVGWVLCSEIVVFLVSRVDTDGLNGVGAGSSTCDEITATSADNQVILRARSNIVVAGEVFEDLEFVGRASNRVVTSSRDKVRMNELFFCGFGALNGPGLKVLDIGFSGVIILR